MTPEQKLAMARECADIGYAQTLAQAICLEVAELPDRTSPDDWPDAMLVTADELTEIVIRQSQDRMQERVRAETDWQDIATAPRDGSFIDIWFAPQTDTGKDLIACRVPNCSWEDGNWYTDRNVRIWGRVTHWRPLPPPPAIRETPHAEG